MGKNTARIPLSDLAQEISATWARVRTSQRPWIITRRGKAEAVLLSVDAYTKGEKERRMLKLLARGERDIAQNKGFDLDDVLAGPDALLSKK
jgi:prevent-host-death family protein